MEWVRISAVDRHSITAIYEFLIGLCGEYNNFREWYYEKVVPGLASGERLIYAVMDNETVAEKKICTLRVAKNYRNQGIATALLKIAFKELQCPKPIITVSSYHIDEFKSLLEKNGFVLYKEYMNYYKQGITEYSFNGPLNEAIAFKRCA